MARNIQDLTNVDGPDSLNPEGRVRDESSPGVEDGTEVNEAMLGDVMTFFSTLLTEAGLVANGNPDNEINGYQLLDALQAVMGSFKNSLFSASEGNEYTSATAPSSVFLKPDGTKMYYTRGTGLIYELDLSTDYDVSTASDVQNVDFSTWETVNLLNFWFRDDGLKLYIVGNTKYVHEFDLSTAWDISTKSFVDEYDFSANLPGNTSGIVIKEDGTKLLVEDAQYVAEYTFGTAWDVTTLSFVQRTEYDAAGNGTGLAISKDGLTIYLTGDYELRSYALSASWDITTLTETDKFLSGNFNPIPHINLVTNRLFTVGSEDADITEIILGTKVDRDGLKTGLLSIESPVVPVTASDRGAAGTVAWDSNYIYICVASDTWKRAAISSW